MKLVTPNYSKRSPVVNDSHFSDAKIGSPNSTFNPGASADPMPAGGPPKVIQVPGKKVFAKGLTNKRFTQNI